MAQCLRHHTIGPGDCARAAALVLGAWHDSMDMKRDHRDDEGEVTVEGFLILTGVLLMLIGLVAMIEGNLHCLGILQRKKGRPWWRP